MNILNNNNNIEEDPPPPPPLPTPHTHTVTLSVCCCSLCACVCACVSSSSSTVIVNTVSARGVPSESHLKRLSLGCAANQPVYNLTPTLTSINCLLIFPPGTLQYCRPPSFLLLLLPLPAVSTWLPGIARASITTRTHANTRTLPLLMIIYFSFFISNTGRFLFYFYIIYFFGGTSVVSTTIQIICIYSVGIFNNKSIT